MEQELSKINHSPELVLPRAVRVMTNDSPDVIVAVMMHASLIVQQSCLRSLRDSTPRVLGTGEIVARHQEDPAVSKCDFSLQAIDEAKYSFTCSAMHCPNTWVATNIDSVRERVEHTLHAVIHASIEYPDED